MATSPQETEPTGPDAGEAPGDQGGTTNYDNESEAARFLTFERYWGSPVLLNAREMVYIVQELFVGYKLSTDCIRTSDGARIDLRNITAPIIVFCSWGDDITPPPQALDWILDLYDNAAEIVRSGQTIIYCLHQSIGHLGIFVSGKVTVKEHAEFIGAMDMIDMMPPGLYEAVITDIDPTTAHPELLKNAYLFRVQARTLADIRSLGQNSTADEARFATVARVSEINGGFYRTFLRAPVRSSARRRWQNPSVASSRSACASRSFRLVRRICGRRQVPAVCQVHDTARFP